MGIVTRSRWREVARFEATLQGGEFLTWLYVAVFFLLTFGYTASGAVELVTGRGALPKNAPWALAQAMAGVTAFGQVITTMITATAVMRDVATRQQELLFATPLSRRDYLWGRWAGALAVMFAVYAAIPVGLVTGTMMPWVTPGSLQPFVLSSYVRPLLMLVVPNVLVVSALFFAAGAMGRSFMTILLLGIALVACWTTGVALVRDGTEVGALLDPFGNAALEWATRAWDADARAAGPIPFHATLLANRALWLAGAAAALVWMARHYRMEVVAARTAEPQRDAAQNGTPPRQAPRRDVPSAAATTRPLRAALLTGRWTFRWTIRERGFLTLATLGALNALGNAWRIAGTAADAGALLAGVEAHVRVFFILIATIYAGELVWRERDVRIDAMHDAAPPPTGALVAGKVLGIVGAELLLSVPLVAGAWGIGVTRHVEGMSLALAVTWIGGLVVPFLVQLTLLSLLVHAVLQHKVAGHVALILGWVLAIAMERSLALPALLRFGNLPPYTWTAAAGFGSAGPSMCWFVLYWTAVGIACAQVAALVWVRGHASGAASRARDTFRHLQRGGAWPLLATLALAAGAAWFASTALAASPSTH